MVCGEFAASKRRTKEQFIMQINAEKSVIYRRHQGPLSEVGRMAASGFVDAKLESRIASEMRITIIFYA
jgi:hypothetical protein